MYTPTDEEREIIRIMQTEVSNWEEGAVNITDKVQFLTKNIVQKARKNYFGIFNEPNDPITGREKIFVPFTEWIVETMLKNIDIDTKDIEVKAKNPRAYLKALIWRYILVKKFEDVGFGEIINDLLRRVAIDGTGFLKALKIDNKLVVRVIDRLNMFYDPSCDDLKQSSGIIERYVLTKPEFDDLGLENSEEVNGEKTIKRINDDVNTTDQETPFVELYERYGYFTRYCLTGKEEDKDKYFYGRAVVSGIGSSPVFHLIEEAKDCPISEFKLKSVPNRLDGRGIPEMLFNVQAYLNEVINLRLAKGRIVHLGLFKLRGNVTPQQFKNLFSTGGIKLTSQTDDVELLQTGAIDPSSYQDEQTAYNWGQRVTGTTRDDEVAGNKPATNALIEQQGATKAYNLRVEDLALKLSRFIKEKMMPIMVEEIKAEIKKDPNYCIRITGDPKVMEKIDRLLAENLVYSQINQMSPDEKMMINDETVEMFVEQIVSEQKKFGEDRYPAIIKELLDDDCDVSIVIGDEQMNKGAIATMLKETISTLASLGLPIRNTLKELYDALGLDGENLIQDMPQIPPTQQPTQPQAQQIPQQI